MMSHGCFFVLQVLLLGSVSMAFGEHASPAEKTGVKMRRSKEAAPLSAKDLQEAVDEALGAGHGIAMQGLEAIRRDIQPMWRGLVQDKAGRVNRRSFRYVVQKFFMQKHHLSIVGLEANLASDTQTEAAMLTQFAPNYIKKVVEGEGAQRGFQKEDAVAMIAALQQLIEHSGIEHLEDAYSPLGFASGVQDATQYSVDRAAMSKILQNYMIRWMLGQDRTGALTLMQNSSLRDEVIGGWYDLADYTEGIIKSFEYAQLHNAESSQVSSFNTLRPHFSFADSQAMTGMMAMSFGDFWRHQCVQLKESLLKMDTSKTGRVKVSDFHAAALAGEWRFGESKEYLRQMGALDETSSWQGPRIMVANYLQAPSNCIISTDHYRVCCASECETLFDELKESIGSADPTPEEIISTVALMSSGFSDEQPEITSSLKSQLQEIARANAGKVPIHGRLFAQWMHYVFPRECIFPHKSGTTSTLSPFEMNDFLATSAEMATHSAAGEKDNGAPEGIDADDEFMSQWSHEEELLADIGTSSSQIEFFPYLKGVIVMGGVAMFLVKSGLVETRFVKDLLPTKIKSHYV